MVKTNSKRFIAIIAVFVVIFALFASVPAYADDLLKASGNVGERVVIADYDNCLTDSEEVELLEYMEKTAKNVKLNIGIVITKDLNGMSDKAYANNFSDTIFGYGSDSIVLMLLNTYNEPKYNLSVDWISTSGSAINKFQKYINNDRIFDRIYDEMGEPSGNKYAYNETTHTYGGYDYYGACKEFVKCVKRYGARGLAIIPVMFVDFVTHHFMIFVIILVVSFLIASGITKSKVKGYKRKAPISAANYMDRSATRVTRQVDRFVREYTTSHTNSSSSGSHGGGHSSGGGSHGGGGGHHR